MTTQTEWQLAAKEHELQQKADLLFVACMQFLITKEDSFLTRIRDYSQQLLDLGYETRFEHRRKALLIRSMFNQMAIEVLQKQQDQLVPRLDDVRSLPDVS